MENCFYIKFHFIHVLSNFMYETSEWGTFDLHTQTYKLEGASYSAHFTFRKFSFICVQTIYYIYGFR